MKRIGIIHTLAIGLLLLLGFNPAICGDRLPSGKLVQSDDEAVLTLPDGQKFVSKTVGSIDTDDLQDVLMFPNGQKFASETAKGGGERHVPFVSTDGAVVAIVRYPATKTATLHIYFKDSTGKFKEVENANEEVAKLLKGVKVQWPPSYDPPQEAAKYALDLLSMSGHTLSLKSVSYWGGHESKTYEFKITVALDGSIALADPTPREQQPSASTSAGPDQQRNNSSDQNEARSVADRVNAFFKQYQVRDYRAVETRLRAEYLTKRFQQERAEEDNHPDEMDGDPYTLSDGAWDIGAIKVKDVEVHGSGAEALVTREGIDHGMKVSAVKENGKWMIDKIYFERRARAEEPNAAPGAQAAATTRLNLETSLPDGPSSPTLELLLCDFVARDASYSPSQRSGIVEAYQGGLFTNEVRKATITNEYTRAVGGETVFVYDFDVEVGMKSSPLMAQISGAPPGAMDVINALVRKTSFSAGVVKRGKKWYMRPAPK